MKKLIRLTVYAGLLLAMPAAVHAQTGDPVIIEVAGEKIRLSEFMEEFNANVGNQLAKKAGVTVAEKQAALEEYVELYATFRAKEYDARMRGFDTTARLRRELAHYRRDLAAPYLIDSTVLRNLLDEAYERNHYSLHAAHILVPVRPDAAPEDTLKAYNHAIELRERALGGEDFYALATEELHAFNPQARTRPNEGDLGYFTVFEMVYPFESAAYALKVGEISMPVRTQYGYHIIKLLDRVEGLYGEVTMAHIWLNSPDKERRRADIDNIYKQLLEGKSFEEMAKLSDDRTTADNGGVLSDATLSQLPPEYIHEIVDMKAGEISKPFFTQYGWHIVKMIRRDTLLPLKQIEGFYKQRMSRDPRGSESYKTFAADCRKKYGIVDCTRTAVAQPKGKRGKKKTEPQMMASLDELISHLNDTVRTGKWEFQESDFTDTTALIITPDRRYTSLDVAQYIHRTQKDGMWLSLEFYAQKMFDEFLDSVTIKYADSQLEKEHPDFAQVVNEYRRGLMLFNYNDEMIWSKAISDTAGLAAFYATECKNKRLDNAEDSIYFYHPRARVTIINVANSNALSPAKAQKIVAKAQKKGLSSNDIKQLLTKKINRKKYPDDNIVSTEIEVVEQTRQKVLDAGQWQVGTYLTEQQPGYRIVVVDQVLPRTIKDLKDARGYYINAWQNEVERRLNESLRTKYNVKIHRDVVHSISL